nr:DUF4423 domain-containing protein [Bacteriovorax sp. HI3]
MEKHFISYLESELSRRQLANSYYSLRAFARDLNIEASLLSKLIRRKVPLTLKMFERLAQTLGLDENTYQDFYEQIKGQSADQRLSDVPIKKLCNEEFKLIEEWYHFTIVELTSLADFQSDPKWIAKKLGITEDEAQKAIERLLAVELLTRTPKGQLISTHYCGSGLKIISDEPETYRLLLQRRWEQIVHKSLEAIEDLPSSKRVQRNLSVAIDSSLVEEARERLRTFTRQLVDEMERKSKKKDHIYELAAVFFPLTKD